MVSAYKKSQMQSMQELTMQDSIPNAVYKRIFISAVQINDLRKGIVINRKQEYNISVKQYLSESNNLNGDKKWITENSANAIT